MRRRVIKRRTKKKLHLISADRTSRVFFSPPSFSCCYFRRPAAPTPSPSLASQVAPGSQSESPNQCISSNSHTLLILPLKFMLLFPAGGPPAGWGPSPPPTAPPPPTVGVTVTREAASDSSPMHLFSACRSHIHRRGRGAITAAASTRHREKTQSAARGSTLPRLLSSFLGISEKQKTARRAGHPKSLVQIKGRRSKEQPLSSGRRTKAQETEKKEKKQPAGPPLPPGASAKSPCVFV